MNRDALKSVIDAAWETRDQLTTQTQGDVRDAVNASLNLLDSGEARVASKDEAGQWVVHEWLKKAVLLSFRLNPNRIIPGGADHGPWWDKVASKFEGWDAAEFERAGFRAVFLASLGLWMLSGVALLLTAGFGWLLLVFAALGAGLGGFQLSAQALVLEFGSRHNLPLRIAVANSASDTSNSGARLASSSGLVVSAFST